MPQNTFRQAVLLTLALWGAFVGQIQAQGFPTPGERFDRADQNQDGQLDRSELEGMRGWSFTRDTYAKFGIDGSRPVSRSDFLNAANKVDEDFRARFSRGDFGRGPAGGPPSFGPPGGSPPPTDRRPEESVDRDERRDDRRREERREESRPDDSKDRRASGSSSKSKRTEKAKVRVTKELPEEYRDKDKNNDGQIALYEWDRKAFAKFQELDRDRDGYLTPSELVTSAPKKESDKSKSSATKTKSGVIASTYKLPASADTQSNSAETTAVKSASAESSTSGKYGSTEKSKSGDSARPKADTPGDTAFRSLDTNNDGQLDADEWNRARSAKNKFEKAGVTLTLPIKQSQFVDLYTKASDKSGQTTP